MSDPLNNIETLDVGVQPNLGSVKSSDEIMPDQPILSVMTSILTRDGTPLFTVESDTVIRFPYRGKNGEWQCYGDAREDTFLCCFYSIFPEQVPEEKRSNISELLTKINYTLTVGNFEMDFTDGEVRFRTSLDVEGDRLSEALCRRLMMANVSIMDRYFTDIGRALAN